MALKWRPPRCLAAASRWGGTWPGWTRRTINTSRSAPETSPSTSPVAGSTTHRSGRDASGSTGRERSVERIRCRFAPMPRGKRRCSSRPSTTTFSDNVRSDCWTSAPNSDRNTGAGRCGVCAEPHQRGLHHRCRRHATARHRRPARRSPPAWRAARDRAVAIAFCAHLSERRVVKGGTVSQRLTHRCPRAARVVTGRTKPRNVDGRAGDEVVQEAPTRVGQSSGRPRPGHCDRFVQILATRRRGSRTRANRARNSRRTRALQRPARAHPQPPSSVPTTLGPL